MPTPRVMSTQEFEAYLEDATYTLAGGWEAVGNRPLTPHEQELLKAQLWSYFDIHRHDEVP